MTTNTTTVYVRWHGTHNNRTQNDDAFAYYISIVYVVFAQVTGACLESVPENTAHTQTNTCLGSTFRPPRPTKCLDVNRYDGGGGSMAF